MALVNFKKGLLANLPSSYAAGTFYAVTDERALYLDISDSERIRFGDFQEFATLDALKANTNPSTSALYYVTGLNCLAKWNGTDYVQINLDTGATSVEVVGDGNAVTAASYDAVTRKLTLTMGATYATPEEVDSAIDAKVGELKIGEVEYETVKAYVDEKTSGIATDAALGELTERVTAAEGEIDALQAQVGEGTVSDQIDAKIEALKLADTYEAKGEAAKVQEALDAYMESNDAAVKSAADAAKAAQDDVDALELKVGEPTEGKTIVQMIADAQTAATYDDTQVKADIKANADAIALLNDGAEVAGSVDYKIAQAVAAIMENPDETMNSINELVTWCNDHAADALALSNQVTTNKDDIAALEGLVGETGVAEQIAAAIEAALKIDGVDKYALAADLTAAIARIAALEGKSHEHANKDVIDGITAEKVAAWDAAEANAIAKANELNTAMDERMQVVEGKAHEHANKELLDSYTQTEADLADAVAKKHAHENADVLAGIDADKVAAWDASEQNAKDYADEKIAAAALAWGEF